MDRRHKVLIFHHPTLNIRTSQKPQPLLSTINGEQYGPLLNTLSGWCPAIAAQCCRYRRARSRPFSMKNQYFASTMYESFLEMSCFK